MVINYNGESKVIKRLCDIVNSMSTVRFKIVNSLPAQGEENVIYLVPKSQSETDNVYDEYVWINNDWELIGSTEIDLSNYYTKTESDGRYVQPSSLSTVATTGDYDDLIDKPSIPANGELMTEDLDDVKDTGFYVGANGNSCAHKPSGLNGQFGLIVVKTATSVNKYHKQFCFQPTTGRIFQRTDTNASGWSAWTEVKTTDTTYTGTGYISINGSNEISTTAEPNVQSDWSQSDNTADDYIKNKPTLSAVATSGDYDDLTNKPTIPVVNDATLTLQKDGVDITGGTFTANASSNKTINIDTTDKVDWVSNSYLGSKNHIIFPYYETTHEENGITWTVYPDGTIMADGTATDTSSLVLRANGEGLKALEEGQSYILSGCPSGGGLEKYGIRYYTRKSDDTNINNVFDTGDGVSFSVPSNGLYDHDYAFCRIYTGTTVDHIIFKPMIRIASDLDATYQPYGMTNQELTKKKANDIDKVDWITNGNIGAKNLLPYPYAQTTQTVNGVTVTDLGDGSLDFNNTSTQAGVKIILVANDTTKAIPLKKVKYKFTWGNTTAPRMDFTLIKQDNTTQTITGDNGYIDLDNTDGTYKGVYYIRLRTSATASFNHKVIYPMMRYATDSDETWQPYAMTNKELTDKKADKWKYLGDDTNPPTINKSDYDELCFVFDIVWGTLEHEILSVVYPTDAYPSLSGWETAKIAVRGGVHQTACVECDIVESGGVITLSNFFVWKEYGTSSSYALDSCKIYGR